MSQSDAPTTAGAGSFVSVYTGAGGMDLGFVRAGFHPVWANDSDRWAVETYRHNFGHPAVHGDVQLQQIPSGRSADLVIGGPPCQGFSVAGRMDPTDPRSQHVRYFMAVVNHVKPRVFVMENVKALAVNQRWAGVLNELRQIADALGYRTQLLLLNASHYGVPQARERMFLVGMQDGALVAPEPTSAKTPPTVGAVLKALPPYGSAGNDGRCSAKVTPALRPILRRSPFAGMLFNGKGRVLNLEAPASTLPASMGGNRTPIIDQLQLENGGPSWVESYHRHLWAGGEPYGSIPDHLRRLTVQEAAALQTFPRTWAFQGPQSAQFRQIGNAVPPDLAFRVALAVRDALGTQVSKDLASAVDGADFQAALPAVDGAPLLVT
jgi:DNA (cytosine-5)-methyltransferase 1